MWRLNNALLIFDASRRRLVNVSRRETASSTVKHVRFVFLLVAREESDEIFIAERFLPTMGMFLRGR